MHKAIGFGSRQLQGLLGCNFPSRRPSAQHLDIAAFEEIEQLRAELGVEGVPATIKSAIMAKIHAGPDRFKDVEKQFNSLKARYTRGAKIKRG